MVGDWGATPKESVLAEVGRAGLDDVVARRKALLSGRGVDARFLFALAGPAPRQVLDGSEGGPYGRWPKVWALRGLLLRVGGLCRAPVVAATTDESWRVREMAARVIGAHAIDDALEDLNRLVDDPATCPFRGSASEGRALQGSFETTRGVSRGRDKWRDRNSNKPGALMSRCRRP